MRRPRLLVSGWMLCWGLSLTAAPRAEESAIEEIIVTGSRIPRPDFESASPIVSVLEREFERTAALTVESVLNTLPQLVPTVTSTSNLNGTGQANLDLRGLGAPRTLVLVDGRRMTPANGDGVADLNVIPPALIERVEIVTGGASAVYGADAVAGVVNFRLKRRFEGVEISGSWGQYEQGDGEDTDIGLLAGTSFAEERGSIVGYIGYADREQIDAAARDFSQVWLGYDGPGQGVTGPDMGFFPIGSRQIEEGRVGGVRVPASVFHDLFETYGYPRGEVPSQSSFGFNTDGTLFTSGIGIPGSVANFRGTIDPLLDNGGRAHFYNLAPRLAMRLPLERISVFSQGSFELSDTVEVYAQGLYADYTANAQYAPVPLQDVSMPASNPLIPPDLKLLLNAREDPDAPVDFVKRMSEVGPRIQENQSYTYDVTLGARGIAFGDWDFDAYLQHGKSDQTKTGTGNIRRSKVEELTYAADGGRSICSGGFNPFGLGSLSDECADYVSVDSESTAVAEQYTAEATLRGPLLTLPAGELEGAFGVLYRENRFRFHYDDLLRTFLPDGRPDNAGFDASDNIDGEESNLDVYAELLVPLLAGRPGVESLDAVFGYRYSDSESFEATGTWKAELIYAPLNTLRLRSSIQHAVRVPSIDELDAPLVPFMLDLDMNDPCARNSSARRGTDAAAVEALCVAQGMPEERLDDYRDDFYIDAAGVAGGNPQLQPEEADTLTLGVVLQSPFDHPLLSGMQLALDWYKIEIEDTIEFLGAEQYIPYCYDRNYNPDFVVNNAFCANFARDPVTGEIVDVVSIYQNLALQETTGVDMQLDWVIAAGAGQLSLAWYLGWVDSLEQTAAPGATGVETVGTIGGFAGARPDWKWNLTLGYAIAGFDVNARWRFIESMQDSTKTYYEVPNYNYYDLYAGYAFEADRLDGLSLRLGIENLTDKEPPIFPMWSEVNTDPSQYEIFGRRYFLSLSYAL